MAGFRDALRALFTPPPGLEPRALTFEQVWGHDRDWEGWSSSASGEQVTVETALRSIAVQAAIRLLVNDIGSLPVDAYRSQENGKKELRRPSWVVEPVPNNPNVTWEDHVKQVVFSLLTDGNAFTYCFPSVTRTEAIRAIDPATVEIRGGVGFADTTYRVAGVGDLTPAEVLHIPWMVQPGKNRGMNTIQAAQNGIGMALAADQFTGAFFRDGSVLSGVIEFPQGVTPSKEQVDELKADFRRKHSGARKSHAVGALTGGAAYKPFETNNRDSQLLELRDQIVEEVARLFGIPPHMLGSQKPGAVGYASVEQRSIDYVTHAVLPIVRRIEVGYSRLLRGQQTYLKFNLKGLLAGDQAARSAFYHNLLQDKVFRRDEVRALEDMPFDPESVGYLETPNNNPPEPPASHQEPPE